MALWFSSTQNGQASFNLSPKGCYYTCTKNSGIIVTTLIGWVIQSQTIFSHKELMILKCAEMRLVSEIIQTRGISRPRSQKDSDLVIRNFVGIFFPTSGPKHVKNVQVGDSVGIHVNWPAIYHLSHNLLIIKRVTIASTRWIPLFSRCFFAWLFLTLKDRWVRLTITIPIVMYAGSTDAPHTCGRIGASGSKFWISKRTILSGPKQRLFIYLFIFFAA